jgi:hypothetical protein
MKNDASTMIACCGLVCSECPIFKATRDDDGAARAAISAFYAEKHGMAIPPGEIACDGCVADGGKLHANCRECAIRNCCRGKGLPHCGLCKDAPCDQLKKLHDQSHAAKHCFEALLGHGDCCHDV